MGSVHRSVVLAAAVGLLAGASQAGELYWQGGNGTWDATSSSWRAGSAAGAAQGWTNADPNADVAVFTGTGSTVKLNSDSQAINVNGLRFASNGHTVGAPDSGSAVLNLSGTNPTISVPGTWDDGTITASLTGGNLIKAGPGGLKLYGANTHASTTISGGRITMGSPGALGTGRLTIQSGSLSGDDKDRTINNDQTWRGSFQLRTGKFTNQGVVTLASNSVVDFDVATLNASTPIGEDAPGRSLKLTSNAWGGTANLNAANTFTGGLTVSSISPHSGMYLNLGNAAALGTGTFTIGPVGGASGFVRIDNTTGSAATISTNNAQVWSADFAFKGTNNLDMGTGAVTLSGSRQISVGHYVVDQWQTWNKPSAVLTISGAIGDGGNGYGLNQTGTGTLVLAGANTYTGDTVISNGTVTLAEGGSLLMKLTDTGSNKITGNGAGVDTVNLNGVLKLDVSGVSEGGTWTLVDTATLAESYGNGFGLMLADSGAAFAESDGLWTLTQDGRTWSFDESSGMLISVVPEPTTILMGLTGGMLLLSARRRRRA